MAPIAITPEAPYYAVIFSSLLTEENDGYGAMSNRMVELAEKQAGFLGVESVRDGLGITVSYWQDLESIKAWKQNTEHLQAQQKGRAAWYKQFKVRIAKVERDYSL